MNSTEYMTQDQHARQGGTSTVTVTTPLGLPCVLDLEERGDGMFRCRNAEEPPRSRCPQIASDCLIARDPGALQLVERAP